MGSVSLSLISPVTWKSLFKSNVLSFRPKNMFSQMWHSSAKSAKFSLQCKPLGTVILLPAPRVHQRADEIKVSGTGFRDGVCHSNMQVGARQRSSNGKTHCLPLSFGMWSPFVHFTSICNCTLTPTCIQAGRNLYHFVRVSNCLNKWDTSWLVRLDFFLGTGLAISGYVLSLNPIHDEHQAYTPLARTICCKTFVFRSVVG